MVNQIIKNTTERRKEKLKDDIFFDEDTYARIQRITHSYSDHLLCVDDLIEILKDKVFDLWEFIILIDSHWQESPNVLPTLSIYKDKTSKIAVFNSIDEIYNSICENGSKHKSYDKKGLDSIVEFAKSNGYKAYKFTDSCATVLSTTLSDIHVRTFKYIARVASIIRFQSLNFENEKYDIANNEIIKLKTKTKSNVYCHNVNLTAYNLSAFFDQKFKNYNLYCFKHNHKDETWLLSYGHKHNKTNLVSIIKIWEQTALKKPTAGKLAGEYYIIFPFVSRKKKKHLTSLIIITSKIEISRAKISNLYKYIDYYFDVYIEEKKRESLSQLSKKTISLQSRYSNWDSVPRMLNYKEELKEYAQEAFSYIIQITNAFSATIRLYDPIKKKLIRLVEVNDDTVDKEIPKQVSEEIPIKDSPYSINAQTFLKNTDCKKDNYIYEPNLQNWFKKRYRSNKSTVLFPYPAHRRNAKSELCFSLYYKEIKIGVANFESPIRRAFFEDFDYFRTIIDLIENYLSLLFELNDKLWLSQKSQIYQNLHEIQNVIESSDFPNKYRIEINEYINKMDISHTSEAVPLSELIVFKENYIYNYKKKFEAFMGCGEMVDDLVESFHYGCITDMHHKEMTIAKPKFDMLKIIYKNLLDNYRDHCDNERDTLLLCQTRKLKNIINFRLKSSNQYNTKFFNQYLLTPIQAKEESNRFRYGLFITGMLTRHLSGFAQVSNIERESRSELLITIPL